MFLGEWETQGENVITSLAPYVEGNKLTSIRRDAHPFTPPQLVNVPNFANGKGKCSVHRPDNFHMHLPSNH